MNLNFIRSPFPFNTNLTMRSERRHDTRRMARRVALSLPTLALVVPPLHTSINAQQRGAAPQQEKPATPSPVIESAPPKTFSDPDKDYRIAPGDVIQIQIEDAPELSHYYQVSSSGNLEMPVLGLVQAQKKTT